MPIGNPELSQHVLELKRLARDAEDLASHPGERSDRLHELFIEASAVAMRGAAAAFNERLQSLRVSA